jgi:hypothetical protein
MDLTILLEPGVAQFITSYNLALLKKGSMDIEEHLEAWKNQRDYLN